MQHFFKHLEYYKTYLNFYFNRIFTVEGDRFHISVVGTDKKAYSFLMQQKGISWHIVNPDNCPAWIVELEEKLSHTIIELLGV